MAYKINGTTVVDNSRNVTACCVTSCCITATTRMDAPSGNTASRPGSPATGSIYFDTDEASLVAYDGSAWASVGGSEAISFCGMSKITGCVETLATVRSITYKDINTCTGGAGWADKLTMSTGMYMSTIGTPLISSPAWFKPFHVSSDGTAFHVGLAVSYANCGYAPKAYTTVISRDGSDAYQLKSRAGSSGYIPANCCLTTGLCVHKMGALDHNRHVPLVSYSGWTDNPNGGYLGWEAKTCLADESSCGWLIPYASVYNSTCPVYKMCGGTRIAHLALDNFSISKRTRTVYCNTCLGADLMHTPMIFCCDNRLCNMFCAGTGLGKTEAGFGNGCGFKMFLTRDPTDLRYYPASGEARSSITGGTAGRLQGLMAVFCCNAAVKSSLIYDCSSAAEIPSQCMGVAFINVSNSAYNNTCKHLVTWNYSNCCTRVYDLSWYGNCYQQFNCTPWNSHMNGFQSWQKSPTDNDVYYYFYMPWTVSAYKRCVCMTGSKFDFSDGTPTFVCTFTFMPCVCISNNASRPVLTVPVYYDMQTCGMVSMYWHGENTNCQMKNGWGFLVEMMDFNNCSYCVRDYNCINSSKACGFAACKAGTGCVPPNVNGMCVSCAEANFGMGFSPNGEFATMVWGGSSWTSRGVRLDFKKMVSQPCARVTCTGDTTNEKTFLVNGPGTNYLMCCVPFCAVSSCLYTTCAINCNFNLTCHGTGILCCCQVKYYLGPRAESDLCQTTYNQWPKIYDAGYTMGNVMTDYMSRNSSDVMSCTLVCCSSIIPNA